LKIVSSVDLVIMLDCTGSMTSWMNCAKTRINELVSSMATIYPDIPLRVAFVGYRDLRDGEERLFVLPFTYSIPHFQAELGKRTCWGGNILADCVGGLALVEQLDWTATTRMLYHIGDYPCHGVDYNNGLPDRYPKGDPHGLDPQTLLHKLQALKVQYFFGKITNYTDPMIAKFNELAGGSRPYITQFPMDANSMMQTITRSVSLSLTSSLTCSSRTDDALSGASGSRSRSQVREEDVSLCPALPQWSALSAEVATLHCCTVPVSVASLAEEEDGDAITVDATSTATAAAAAAAAAENTPTGTTEAPPLEVHYLVAPQPFEKGGVRLAYYALEQLQKQHGDSQGAAAGTLTADAAPAASTAAAAAHATLPLEGKLVVLKESLACTKEIPDEEERYLEYLDEQRQKYEAYLAPQRAAAFLADTFNALVQQTGIDSDTIRFVPVSLLQFSSRPEQPFFVKEDHIPGTWEKFNGNTGLCAPYPTAEGTNHQAVQAFSHYTHHATQGRLLVVDCQGCYDACQRAFTLTDPAVHSTSLLRYGGTNMGTRGIKRFFKTHVCNEVCRALQLPSAPTD
jgi:hypothetical protein